MPSSGDKPARRVRITFGAMRVADLDRVLEIERASFPSPWKREHFLHELRISTISINRVARRDGAVIAYVCAWRVADEMKINNVAVDPAWRRRGLAERLLRSLLDRARENGCREVTLEVRAGNLGAQALYRALGFRVDGRRAGYYPSEGEDAILMSLSL